MSVSLKQRLPLLVSLARSIAGGAIDSLVERFTRISAGFLFACLVFFFVFVGAIGFKYLSDSTLDKERERLEAVSVLKAHQTADWLKHQKRDTQLMATNRVFQELLKPLRSHQSGKLNARSSVLSDDARVVSWLEDICEAGNFLSAEVLDNNGNALSHFGSVPYSTELIRPLLSQLGANSPVVFLDIQVGPDGRSYIAFAASIPDQDTGIALNLVVSVDMETHFLPMLNDWQHISHSAKLLLFRHDQGVISILNSTREPGGGFPKMSTMSN